MIAVAVIFAAIVVVLAIVEDLISATRTAVVNLLIKTRFGCYLKPCLTVISAMTAYMVPINE